MRRRDEKKSKENGLLGSKFRVPAWINLVESPKSRCLALSTEYDTHTTHIMAGSLALMQHAKFSFVLHDIPTRGSPKPLTTWILNRGSRSRTIGCNETPRRQNLMGNAWLGKRFLNTNFRYFHQIYRDSFYVRSFRRCSITRNCTIYRIYLDINKDFVIVSGVKHNGERKPNYYSELPWELLPRHTMVGKDANRFPSRVRFTYISSTTKEL